MPLLEPSMVSSVPLFSGVSTVQAITDNASRNIINIFIMKVFINHDEDL